MGLLVLGIVASAWAGDRPLRAKRATRSEDMFACPIPSDIKFVATPSTDYSGSDITFHIDIPRYFGNKEKLMEAGLNQGLPPTVTLTMIVYDIDSDEGEVDLVYFNGNHLSPEKLTGKNNKWSKYTAEIPIEQVNLPTKVGETAKNTVYIDVDSTKEGWMTQVEWVSLDIPAPPPVVISHGIKDSAMGSSDLLDSKTGMRDLKAAVEALGLPVHTFSYSNHGFNSIEAGARELAREIEKVKTSNHVDKVTVLCHSMGGIKARHYTTEIDQNAESVDRVIQIATPNGGSDRLEDVWLLRILPNTPYSVATTLLPALRQLEPRSMASYNSDHRLNRGVKYIVLAGENDAYVSLSSAHTMVPAHPKSPESGRRATHGGLVTKESDGGMVNTVIGSTLRQDLLERKHADNAWYSYGAINLAPAFEPTEGTDNLWTVGTGTINLGTTSFAFPFQISGGTGGGASVSFVADEGIDVSKIRSPSGREYSPDDAGVQIDTFGTILTLHITSAEPGTWTVSATRTSGNTALSYAVAVREEESNILLAGEFAEESVRVGSSFVLEMTPTKAGAALTDISGSAIVTFPDGTVQTNALSNVKTGHYRATFKATQAGTYLVTAKMAISGVEYARMFTCTAYGSATKFGTLSADGPADDDGDGFYDRLSVSGTLSSVESGKTYRVFALLADQNGTNIAWAATTVTNGTSTFRLDFDGTAIHEHGASTKYVVSTLRLSEQGEEYAAEIDSRDGAVEFQGMQWSWNNFAHPLLSIPGTGTDTIVSTSTTNAERALQVGLDVEFDASISGTYEYSVALKTADGTFVGSIYGTATLTASNGIATNRLVLSFSGASIADAGIDGPYYVTDLLLWNTRRDFAPVGAYETHSWVASDFGGVGHPSWQFDIVNGSAVVTGVSNAIDYVEIPNMLGGYPVGEIDFGAFYNATNLTHVTIPNSVTNIGSSAFLGCNGLTSVKIGNSVTHIGYRAFYRCSGLTNITIPDSVTYIGSHAFYDCSGLTSATIGNSVTNIGEQAFYSCSGLTSVTIPGSVAIIGDAAFKYCRGLSRFILNNGITSIGYAAFESCSNLSSVTIPDSTTNIGDAAFEGCRALTSATISGSVTNIGDRIFYFCSGLRSVTIGNGVTRIGAWAFYECSGLTSVTLPGSVTNIGEGAFDRCSGLTSITIPASVTDIGEDAFIDCSGLKEFHVAAANLMYKAVDGVLFSKNGKKLLIYPAGKTGPYSIPSGVMKIEDCAFFGCRGLTSVAISDSVASIGERAFCSCIGLTSLAIPNSVTDIGEAAFIDCYCLTSMSIGSGVTSIGASAFKYCTRLTTLSVPASWESTGMLDGTEIPEGCTVVYVSNQLDLGAESRTFPADASSGQMLAVTANVSWTATSLASWLTVNTASGNGNGNIGYAVAANTGTASRTGSIMVNGGGLSRTFTVMQSGAAIQLELEATGQSFTSDGAGGQKLAVTANVAWSAQSSASWLTVETANGSGNGEVAYNVAANARTEDRMGTITVAGGGLTRIFLVTQSGQAPILELGTTSESFTADAMSGQMLAVTANVAWTTKSSASWLTVSPASGSGNGTITYNVAANTGTASRTGTITVAGGGLARTFTVTQGGASAKLELGMTSQSFTADAASKRKLVILANVSWTAQSSASWLTLSTSSGSGNGNIVYAMTANTSTGERMGIITVTGGGLMRLFLVTQAGRTVPQESPVEVPRQWLEENAADVLAANGGDCEAAAKAFAANGLPLWKCYVAGLSTTNAMAEFKVKSLSIKNGKPVVEWDPDLNKSGTTNARTYTVQGKPTMTNDWGVTNASSRFFRVLVEMPK